MLRTYVFALTAGNTVFRFASLFGKKCIVREIDRPAFFFKILPHVFVIQGEILRDSDVHGTAFRTVMACRAGYRDPAVDDFRHMEADIFFFVRKRGKV